MNSSLKSKISKKSFFKKWINRLKKNKIKILNTKYVFNIKRNNSDWEVLGVDIKIKIKKKSYYRYAQISPDSVLIVPILKLKNFFYTILVSQLRAPAGGHTFDF